MQSKRRVRRIRLVKTRDSAAFSPLRWYEPRLTTLARHGNVARVAQRLQVVHVMRATDLRVLPEARIDMVNLESHI